MPHHGKFGIVDAVFYRGLLFVMQVSTSLTTRPGSGTLENKSDVSLVSYEVNIHISNRASLPSNSISITYPSLWQIAQVAAAWAILLAKYQGEDSVTFETQVSSAGLESLSGSTELIQVSVPVDSHRGKNTDSFVLSIAKQVGARDTNLVSEWRLRIESPFVSLAHKAVKGWSLTRSGQLISILATGNLTCPDQIQLHLSCQAHVASPSQLQRLCEQLGNIIDVLASPHAPGVTSKEISALTVQDWQQILKWNAVPPKPAISSTIQALVAVHVTSSPDAIAVHSWNGDLTYRELDQCSTVLASHLMRTGNIGRGNNVLVGFEKSMWFIVAVLAVLKAGAAFVPLEPSHPAARLQAVADSAKAEILLTSPESSKRFQSLQSVQVILVGADEQQRWRLDNETDTQTWEDVTQPDDLACILFTSGSTGTPKGICLDHSCIVTSITSQGAAVAFDSTSRVLQFAAHVFDICYTEIFTTLSLGGCVCIPSEHERLNGLADAINALGVNHLVLTNTVAESLDPAHTPAVTRLEVCGEPMTPAVLRKWTTNGKVSFTQTFGPAECTMTCMVTVDMQPDDVPWNIGIARDSCQAWLVDPADHERLSPVGAIGELVIEGPTVACGYLNDDAHTKAAFIAPPAWLVNIRGSDDEYRRVVAPRIYKTGDLARYNDDGTMSFVGRKDNQVKLHGGLRVELGDIEHHIHRLLPKSSHALAVDVVLTNPNNPKMSSRRMLAVFVALEGHRSSAAAVGGSKEAAILTSEDALQYAQGLLADIRAALRTALPYYMIPELAIPLSELPVNSSFKLNRRTMKDLVAGLTQANLCRYTGISPSPEHHQAPRTPAEKQISQLWAQVLQIPKDHIGANDSFMSLGGDSIAAMRLVTLARQAGMGLTVEHILKHPILSEISGVATSLPNNNTSRLNQIPPFALVGGIGTAPLDLVALQCGLDVALIEDIYLATPTQSLFMSTTLKHPKAHSTNVTIPLPPDLDRERFKLAWEAVVQRCPILRTRLVVEPEKQLFLQVVTNKNLDLVWATAEDVNDYLAQTSKQPFSLGCPLSRQSLITDAITKNSHHFVWTVHHTVYDIWNVRLVLGLLEDAYNEITHNFRGPAAIQPTDMPTLKDREPSFVRFVQEQVMKTDMQAVLGFAIPRVRARSKCRPLWEPLSPSYQPFTTKRAERRISPGLLSRGFRSPTTTMANMLYAAWVLVLYGQSRSSNLADDTGDGNTVALLVTSMGRNTTVGGLGTDRLVAPLVTYMLLCTRLDPAQSIADLTTTIQSDMMASFPYEHVAPAYIAKTGGDTMEQIQRRSLRVNVLPPREPVGTSTAQGLHLTQGWVEKSFEEREVGTAISVDMTLHGDDGITVLIRFDENVFLEDRVDGMLVEFERCLIEVLKANQPDEVDVIETIGSVIR